MTIKTNKIELTFTAEELRLFHINSVAALYRALQQFESGKCPPGFHPSTEKPKKDTL